VVTTHNVRVNENSYIFCTHGTFVAFKINKYFSAQYYLTRFNDSETVILLRGRY